MSSSIGANLDRVELIAIDCESLELCVLLRLTSHSLGDSDGGGGGVTALLSMLYLLPLCDRRVF